MKTSVLLLASLALLGSLVLRSPAQATTTLLHDNFESYTVGATPTLPGDGNPNSWSVATSLNATVQSGNSISGEAPNEQVLRLQANNGQLTTNLAILDRKFNRVTGSASNGLILTLSFKLKINSFAASDYRINLMDSTLSSNNVISSIRIGITGEVNILTRANGPGSGSATNSRNPLGSNLAIDQWYEFEVTLDFQSQKYTVSTTNLTTLQSGSTAALHFYSNIRTLDQFRITPTNNGATPTNTALNWELDDLHIQSVPEPGTVGLLLGGALLTLYLKGRNRRTS